MVGHALIGSTILAVAVLPVLKERTVRWYLVSFPCKRFTVLDNICLFVCQLKVQFSTFNVQITRKPKTTAEDHPKILGGKTVAFQGTSNRTA